MNIIGKYLSTEQIAKLKAIDSEALPALENLFHLTEIEDRYTEKSILIDACFYIQLILQKCAFTQN